MIWAVSLSTDDLSAESPNAFLILLIAFSGSKDSHPPFKRSYSTSIQKLKKLFTYINFTENQLSSSLISLSPLTASHPSILQHTRVQPSIS